MRYVSTVLAMLLLPLPAVLAADPPAPAPAPADDAPKVEMNDLEKQFERTMSGATLVGRFSVEGKEDQLPKEEKYTIAKGTKIGPALCLFPARLGERGLPIPLPIPVKWAGDTPVISVTK